MPDVAAIILAAGRATRFGSGPGRSKLLALLDGKPLVRHAAEAALASRVSEIIVVTGHASEAVRAVLEPLSLRIVDNPRFATGMASSLQAGIAALRSGTTGVVVMLADMPRVTGAIVDQLIARFEGDGSADAVVPTRDGRRGNPVLLGRSLFGAIADLDGDEGARRLLARGERRVLTCEIDDIAIEADVDTPDALDALGRA